MKLASYIAGGAEDYGVVVDNGVVGMRKRTGFPTLRDALLPEGLDAIRKAATGAKPDHTLSDIRFLPVIPNPGKIVCAGINYRAHAAETGRELPVEPSMFARFADTLIGHEGEMVRPKISTNFDFEGELTIVIGRPGRYIKPADALAHVAGYTIMVDGSVRDYQKFSVTSGKNFPGTGPLGPWIVTTDEIPDPHKLTLTTRLNGQVMQQSGTDILIHDVPALIAFVSNFTPLAPGDIIATGTPDGVGHRRNPPVWMKAGDVLEVEISGIGTLRNHIVDET
ncbi:MAG: 5-carboxymethyl-2-hydroxymuconate isomerase [Rhizobiales bacterium]|nr:5-carboxymethyl-2-hydroxymuconate isomerase [Hyphomicrobiales bacterium]